MTMSIYQGTRDSQVGAAPVLVDGEPLDPRNDLMNHSPLGFQWGYGGSGPAQLALAILAHHFRQKGMRPRLADDRAVQLHQAFKFAVIGRIQMDRWNLTTFQVEREIEKIEREDPSCA
jgi:hypothetical protein